MGRRRGRKTPPLELTAEEREALERYVRRGTTSQQRVLRARIVLLCSQGLCNTEVAQRLGLCKDTVGKWRRRFIEQRLDGLGDAPRPGTPRKITDGQIEELVVRTLETKPQGAAQWSTRLMAKELGISNASVSRIWRAFGLQPHRAETFQLSTDPDFIEKVRDIVGLYLDPPTGALVLSVDEKSQIQALNRTQPVLPLRPGQMERRTPEYQRNGTTSLFAALDVATGYVIGKCYRHHRSREFLGFLKLVEESTPPELDLHLILDNYATHKTAAVKRWLLRNPRVHLHFIPTHSSWLNQVDAWFGILTKRQIKRGSHHSVAELETAIYEFLDAHNEEPRPFRWTKTADEILGKLGRLCADTLRIHGDK